jgi:hypothetical protein
MQVSTFSQDVARGLTHPASVAARRERIDAHNLMAADIQRRITSVCLELRQIARTEQHVIDVLHALAGGLASPSIKSSDINELIDLLDMLADEVEYK